MLKQAISDAWHALRRNRTRSLLTVTGIVWGIMAVTFLIAYADGFRAVLIRMFQAFGKNTIVCWPRQTSEQAGGQRAGKPVRIEIADAEYIKQEAFLVKTVCLETFRTVSVQYQGRLVNAGVRGVCPEYGDLRNEVPMEGRWLSTSDQLERRRVAFIGWRMRQQLFSGRPAVDQEIQIGGVRFMVVGVMDRKLSFGEYYTSDDRSIFIPYSTAGDLWNTRYASNLVFAPVAPEFELRAEAQVLAALAQRQHFSPHDKKALQMFGPAETLPLVDGITIGLQILLLVIGALTLGIGGVGVMNIMLVSVNERIREVGLRRALGATRWQIRLQFLTEALLLMAVGGAIGIVLSYALSLLLPSMPLLGAIFEDSSGKGDIQLAISLKTVLVSTAVLTIVGVISGLIPAMKASQLDPVEALRYE